MFTGDESVAMYTFEMTSKRKAFWILERLINVSSIDEMKLTWGRSFCTTFERAS